jgi:hypothetical protein
VLIEISAEDSDRPVGFVLLIDGPHPARAYDGYGCFINMHENQASAVSAIREKERLRSARTAGS